MNSLAVKMLVIALAPTEEHGLKNCVLCMILISSSNAIFITCAAEIFSSCTQSGIHFTFPLKEDLM
jgi:hypothetical protein